MEAVQILHQEVQVGGHHIDLECLSMDCFAEIMAYRERRNVFYIEREVAQEEDEAEDVFEQNNSSKSLEEKYNRKEKSLSQLSKKFLYEFGGTNNRMISMFEVTERLSK